MRAASCRASLADTLQLLGRGPARNRTTGGCTPRSPRGLGAIRGLALFVVGAVAEQKGIVALYGLVAFAGGLPKPLDVDDLNLATGVFDQSGLLQSMGDDGDAGAADGKHFGEKFLGEHQSIRTGEIAGAEKPA